MKRIGIDARLYFKTGIGVYIRNLLHYLQKKLPAGMEVYVYVMREDAKNIVFSNKHFHVRSVSYPWHSVAEQVGFVGALYRDNLDLMHFTYFSYPVLYRRRYISTVHDVTPLLFRTGKASTKNKIIYEIKHAVLSYMLAHQVRSSVCVLTPTETVKNQLIELYGERFESKINVTYEGINYELLNSQSLHPAGWNIKDFFLYVGNFYPHKNIERLVRAFARVQGDVKLVLVGPEDYFYASLNNLVKKLSQQNRIRFFPGNTAGELIFFYKNARALVHPSLSEGFGLPIVESAYFGLPIIASDIAVFRELLGNNYTAFNPYDIEDIAQKISGFSLEKKEVDYTDILKKCSFETMTEQTLIQYETYCNRV